MLFIKGLKQVTKSDVTQVGGKAAALGELIRTGMPVPKGFVILTSAFDLFLQSNGAYAKIDRLLQQANTQDTKGLAVLAKTIQKMVQNVEMPVVVREEILAAYKRHRLHCVAVRSSATVEDGVEASWAGQLESYLNISEKELLDRVKACWISLFSHRAIAYRLQFNQPSISVAVVIQEMIDADVSGVAFSVHPVTQNTKQVVIEACRGLGEALVSGTITPDSYVVEKEGCIISSKIITSQKKAFVRGQRGNRWVSIKDGSVQKLSDRTIIRLSKILMQLERRGGSPCDVEWVYKHGKLHLVQNRPVTTMKPFIRIFQKFFTREVPLITVEYWQAGESRVLSNLVGGRTKFTPLFIHAGRQTHVYYDMNNPETDVEPLFDYFSKYPKVFYKSAKAFKKNFEKLQRIAQHPSRVSLSEFYHRMVDFFGFLPIVMQFGDTTDKRIPPAMRQHSLDLRILTQDDESSIEEAVLRTMQLPPALQSYASVISIHEVLNNNIPAKKILAQRKRGYIYFEGTLYPGTHRKRFEKTHNVHIDDTLVLLGPQSSSQKQSSKHQVTGRSAFPGTVRGKVRLIRSLKDYKNFTKGEIIVTEMTSPDHGPYMRDARAIITDEGGFTCHAAIACREMRVPCIVGTKRATHILKNGEVVSVDAGKGIVKRRPDN